MAITRLQEKCPTCGKPAHEKSVFKNTTHRVVFLQCGHLILKPLEKADELSYETMTFDGDENCQHEWNGTICMNCNAKRLYSYQITGAKAIEDANGRFAIFDEMGLGKTIQALAYLKFHPEAYPYLWVTKSGIKYQHAQEIIRLLGIKNFPLIIRNSKDHFIPGVSGYVVSYDLFRNLDFEKLEQVGFQSIILDECQAVKNIRSQRTQSLRRLVQHIPRVIPLSGTPWKNRGSEFYVVLNMLNPTRFWNESGFKNEWVENTWDGNRMKEGGIRNPEQFKEYIKDLAIRRERIEVLPELPVISRNKLVIELPDYARQSYDKAKNELRQIYNDALLEGEEDSFATHQKMNELLMLMRQVVGIAKVPHTIEHAKEFLEETDRKLVIFVHHIKCGELILAAMREFCAANNMNPPLSIVGGIHPEEKFKIQEQFNGPDYRILIGSTLASGEGLNLQTCSDCIMHERQWNPANEEQAEGRFIRIGQKADKVTAVYVHAESTVDTELDRLVEKKRVAFHKSMNKGEMPVWNEDSLRKELIRSLVA